MKGVTTWSFRPYRHVFFETGDIYICRVCPGVEKITFDWLPTPDVSEYTVHIGIRGSGEYVTAKTTDTTYTAAHLADDTDYEFFVSAGVKKSRVRLARTGFVPGDCVVNYLHPEDEAYSFSGQYLCSPSLLRHPDGYLLASMDVYGENTPQDLTLIFRSDDDGESWHYVSELYPCCWGKMFVYRGVLYMLSNTTEYGDLVIGCSTDGGKTFGTPTVLMRGTCRSSENGVHHNPQPIRLYNGRLWTALEWGSWTKGGFASLCASVDAEADLMDAANWSFTEPLSYDPAWPRAAKGPSHGCIEGCVTVSPEGKLYNILRYEMDDCVPNHGRAVILRPYPDAPEHQQAFEKIIDFPCNHAKFEIHRDDVTGLYFSVASEVCEEFPQQRNLLTLIVSKDLETWEKVQDIFDYRHIFWREVGFQYISFLIEGEDILFLSRTAFNRAHTFHDANYSVFSRIKNFRNSPVVERLCK